MIYVAFIFAALLEILLPLGLFLWLKRRYGVSWLLFGVGVLTFIGSQVVHIPLLLGVQALLKFQLPPYAIGLGANLLYAALLGMLAGLCEEPARLVGYRLLKTRANSFGAALALGAGHGGIESILVGVSLVGNFVLMVMVQQSGTAVGPVTPELAAKTLSGDWYMPLINFAERLFAVVLHLTLSVMVWWAVSRRAWGWFVGAVLYHSMVNALAVSIVLLGGSVYLVEGILALLTVINLGGLVWLARRGVFSHQQY